MTRWTAAEDATLLRVVQDAHQGASWLEISLSVPGRSFAQCRDRWIKAVDPSLRRGPWTTAEDDRLRALYAEHGAKWTLIAGQMPGRHFLQCRTRWTKTMDPALAEEEWTDKEDGKLKNLFAFHGQEWERIAELMEGRNAGQCKKRWTGVIDKWTREEDVLLMHLIGVKGEDWAQVAGRMQGRCAWHCEQHWVSSLKPVVVAASGSSDANAPPASNAIAAAAGNANGGTANAQDAGAQPDNPGTTTTTVLAEMQAVTGTPQAPPAAAGPAAAGSTARTRDDEMIVVRGQLAEMGRMMQTVLDQQKQLMSLSERPAAPTTRAQEDELVVVRGQLAEVGRMMQPVANGNGEIQRTMNVLANRQRELLARTPVVPAGPARRAANGTEARIIAQLDADDDEEVLDGSGMPPPPAANASGAASASVQPKAKTPASKKKKKKKKKKKIGRPPSKKTQPPPETASASATPRKKSDGKSGSKSGVSQRELFQITGGKLGSKAAAPKRRSVSRPKAAARPRRASVPVATVSKGSKRPVREARAKAVPVAWEEGSVDAMEEEEDDEEADEVGAAASGQAVEEGGAQNEGQAVPQGAETGGTRGFTTSPWKRSLVQWDHDHRGKARKARRQ